MTTTVEHSCGIGDCRRGQLQLPVSKTEKKTLRERRQVVGGRSGGTQQGGSASGQKSWGFKASPFDAPCSPHGADPSPSLRCNAPNAPACAPGATLRFPQAPRRSRFSSTAVPAQAAAPAWVSGRLSFARGRPARASPARDSSLGRAAAVSVLARTLAPRVVVFTRLSFDRRPRASSRRCRSPGTVPRSVHPWRAHPRARPRSARSSRCVPIRASANWSSRCGSNSSHGVSQRPGPPRPRGSPAHRAARRWHPRATRPGPARQGKRAPRAALGGGRHGDKGEIRGGGEGGRGSRRPRRRVRASALLRCRALAKEVVLPRLPRPGVARGVVGLALSIAGRGFRAWVRADELFKRKVRRRAG